MRIEPVRVGEFLGAAVHLGQRNDDRVALRDGVLAEVERGRVHVASGEVDDGTHPLHLEDDSLPVLVVLGVGLGGQPGQHVGVAADALEGPTQRGGGGLVAGGEQREQFVADVLSRHRRSVLVGALQQQRQHVVAFVEVRVGLHGVDQPADHLVVAPTVARQPPPGTEPAVGACRGGQHRQSGTEGDPRRDDAAQLVQMRSVGTEHRPQDGVEGDAHHRFEGFERLTLGPALGFPQCLLFEDGLVVANALAVERGCEQPTPTPMVGAVEGEHRARPEYPGQVGLDVADVLGVGHEQLLGQCRVGDDHGAAENRQLQREHISASADDLGHRPFP